MAILRFGWIGICLFFGLVGVFSHLMLQPPYTIELQTQFIRDSLDDSASPTYCTRNFKDRYYAVLSREELARFHLFETGDPMPEKYTLLESKQEIHQSHILDLPWQYATVTTPKVTGKMPLLRRCLDRLRKKNHLNVAYTPPLYRIDIDRGAPPKGDQNAIPAWLREGNATDVGSSRALPSD